MQNEPYLNRKIRLGDLGLRLFFSVYFFLSGLQWCFDDLLPQWKSVFLFFSNDLSGHRVGLDESHLWLNLGFVRSEPYSFAVLGFVALACGALACNWRPRLSATAVVLCAQILSYSAPGRSIPFDMISYSLIGYWLATFLGESTWPVFSARKEWLKWACAASGLASVYSLSAIAKWRHSPQFWPSPVRAGLLLQYAQFRHESGTSWYDPSPWLVSFFAEPNNWSTVLLSTGLAVEGGAVFFLVLGRRSWIYLVGLLWLHLGMTLFVGVLWPPLVVLLLVLLLGALGFEGDWPSSRGSLKLIPGILATVLCTISLILPWKIRDNATLVAPFSQFNMYAWGEAGLNFYFFKQPDNSILSGSHLREAARSSIQNMDMTIHSRFPKSVRPDVRAGQFACAWLRQRVQGNRLSVDSLEVWARHIGFKSDLNRIVSSDQRVLSCAAE